MKRHPHLIGKERALYVCPLGEILKGFQVPHVSQRDRLLHGPNSPDNQAIGKNKAA